MCNDDDEIHLVLYDVDVYYFVCGSSLLFFFIVKYLDFIQIGLLNFK